VEKVVLFCDGVKPREELVSDFCVYYAVQCDVFQDLSGFADRDI
jgi:hypothetical protein